MRDESINPGLVLPFGDGTTAQLGTGTADLEMVKVWVTMRRVHAYPF